MSPDSLTQFIPDSVDWIKYGLSYAFANRLSGITAFVLGGGISVVLNYGIGWLWNRKWNAFGSQGKSVTSILFSLLIAFAFCDLHGLSGRNYFSPGIYNQMKDFAAWTDDVSERNRAGDLAFDLFQRQQTVDEEDDSLEDDALKAEDELKKTKQSWVKNNLSNYADSYIESWNIAKGALISLGLLYLVFVSILAVKDINSDGSVSGK